MSVNGIYGTVNSMENYNTSKTKSTDKGEKAKVSATESTDKTTITQPAQQEETAAVYDKSKLSEDDRKAIVSQLKADQEKRQSQLTDLVKDMISKQTSTFGQANNIWRFLAKGDFTVDEETRKKAQADIAEDGYWGVEQTSDRIVSFATALAGNDSTALEKMRDAFIKGYKQSEKQWGGKLPDISQRTYDAVMKKFDNLSSSKSDKSEDSTQDGTVIIKKEESSAETQA